MLRKKLKVGIYSYPVRFVTGVIAGDDGESALCGVAKHGIADREIRVSVDTCSDIGETLLHECLHAVFFERDISSLLDDAIEEHVVNQAAVGITALLRDNPWLVSEVVRHAL